MLYTSIYLIKDLSRLTGLSTYTIKYYLNMGLIKEVGRSPETNFRYFDGGTVEELKKIIAYKKGNASLTRIRELLKSNAQNGGRVAALKAGQDGGVNA